MGSESLKHYVQELKWQLVWLHNATIWSAYFVLTEAVVVN